MGLFKIVLFWWLPILACCVFGLGILFRIWNWTRAPSPLSIPLTPAPVSKGAVLGRLLGRMALMTNLRYSSLAFWLAVLTMHLGLAAVFWHHLGLALDPAPAWAVGARLAAAWAAYLLLAALFFLLVRRLASLPVVYLSTPADYLLLVLIICVVLSGLGLRLLARVDLVVLKPYLAGIIMLDYGSPPPGGWLFLVHMFLGGALVVLIPFTRLCHGLMILFNPVLRQTDTARSKGHINPWDHSDQEHEMELARQAGAYRAHLKARWRTAGSQRVLGAAERAAVQNTPAAPDREEVS